MNVIINSTIEFNNKLMKALCESDDDDENNKDVCLISGEKLETTPIQLECKHMYNYGAILDEVKNQKKFSALEINRLKTYQIKCPYCRHIQTGILPWREGYPKVNNVNWPIGRAFKAFHCSTVLKSRKRKGQHCGKKSIEKYCPRHLKLKKKATEKGNISSNIIISSDNVTSLSSSKLLKGCQALLKSGPRKGQKCGSRTKFYSIFSNQNTILPIKIGFCGRHYSPGTDPCKIQSISDDVQQIIQNQNIGLPIPPSTLPTIPTNDTDL